MNPNKHKAKKTFSLPKTLTLKQLELAKAITSKEMVVVTGPAGTGKTYLTAAYAAYMYHQGLVEKIVLTRPTVPVSRTIGLLPGTLEEKLGPWAIPFVEVLEEYLSKGEVECMVKNGKLEIVPFETIRGRTFKNSFIVLDEAQNSEIAEIKAFVTRIGEKSRTIINGDITQSDLKKHSGLTYIKALLKAEENKELADKVGLIEFKSDDIVRSGLTKLFVQAFERE